MTVREVMFFAQELRQRHSATTRDRKPTDTELGAYLRGVKETKEPELRRRVECAAANREVASRLVDSSGTVTPPESAEAVVGSGAPAGEDQAMSSTTAAQPSSFTEPLFSIPTALQSRQKATNLL